MRKARGRRLWVIPVALAGVAAMLPWPPGAIERYYAGAAYPTLQASVTAASNAVPFALFDVLAVAAAAGLALVWARAFAAAGRVRRAAPLGRALAVTLAAAGVAYLWFLAAWGFNYARPPLENRIGFARERVTPEAFEALAREAVAACNRWHPDAHRAGFPAPGVTPRVLAAALNDVERALGRPRPTVPGVPKVTLFAPFFRASGTDGMHVPWLLETLVNPWLTPPERPAVVAHEWAHLSGFAPEDDASFVGLLAALRADAASRYSAWLTLLVTATPGLGRDAGRAIVGGLDPGPRADWDAIIERLATRVALVERVSWKAYDRYLKSQGVAEGVQSYSRVVELMLGMDPSHDMYWRRTP